MSKFTKIISNHLILTTILISFVVNLSHFAQENKVPLEIQFALLPKVLLLEKNLALKENPIRIGIIYDSSSNTSKKIKEKIFEFVDNPTYQNDNSKFEFVSIDVNNKTSIQNEIVSQDLDAIYIATIKSVSITTLSDICKKYKLISFTGIEDYLDKGISILFDIKNNKPKITINLNSAKNEGASFSSYLLRLANIIDNS